MAPSNRGSPPSSTKVPDQTGTAQSLLLHDRMLGERLSIHCRARFLVVIGIVAGVFFARHVVGIENLSVSRLLIVAGLLLVYNIINFILVRRAKAGDTASARRTLRILMHGTITIDFVFLTVTLWLVGGMRSPFRAFYILHVIIAGLLLSRLSACVHAAVGFLMFTVLVVGEWSGVIPPQLPTGAVAGPGTLDGRFVCTVLTVQGLLMAFSLFFLTELTRLLRGGERRLRQTNEELARLTKLQRDFLHIALHDLKAPVAAATSLLQTLRSGLVGPLTEQQQHWTGRIQIRFAEISAFLRDLNTLSMLEAGQVRTDVDTVDVAALLKRAAEEHQDLAELHGHELRCNVTDTLPHIKGIEMLLDEAVANLVTNAIKYTPDGGTIVVRGCINDGMCRIEVEDNGVGIAPEDKEKLFGEFVRLRRQDTRLGRVAGTGLGLAIVDRIVELHRGRIDVVSELDKGSTFIIELPLPADTEEPAD